MKVLVEINCESVGELGTHLHVMLKQVKALAKKQKLDPFHDEFPVDTVLEDNNCYGEHELKVVPDPI